MKTPVRNGTSLSSDTRIELLGAGGTGREVIIALRRLGVETISLNRFETARMRTSNAAALFSPGMP